MVSKRKIDVKGKKYWILIHSVRKGNKIVQKKKYIGKILPPKKRLEQLKKDFLKELSGKRYKFLSKDDVEKIEKKKVNYKNEIKRLSKTEKQSKLKEFAIRYTYDSSKISGLNVTLRQTFLILKEGIIPKDFKNLRVAKALENHEKGFLLLTKYKGKLDIKFIKRLHKSYFLALMMKLRGI